MKTVEFTDEQFRVFKAYIGNICDSYDDCNGCPLSTNEDVFCPNVSIEKADED